MQVVILGLARQGKALARFFAQQGARVTVSDLRTEAALQAELADLQELDVEYELGAHPLSLLEGCDLLCLSGGVPLQIPIVQEARQRGIPLSNDAQEFLARCPAPVVGITGSAGKTTTTTLVGKMLQAAGLPTWVGGNIGNPLLNDLPEITPEARVVMELSSFQLELMTVSPHIAVVLNVTPNHLDRHKTMAAYLAAKRNIVAYQRAEDVAVLGYDDPNARGLQAATPAQVHFFSGRTEVADGAYLDGDVLTLQRAGERGRRLQVCRREELRLRGYHNVLNVLAALAVAHAAGATVAALREVCTTFEGVAHRLEEVRRWRGSLWVNDSIATAPERVLAALASFEEPLVLLAGGRDKDLPWQAFARRVVARVRALILFGEAAPMIQEVVSGAWGEARAAGEDACLERILIADELEEAVRLAAQQVQPGEVVLLSPGGTSFDAFRDFAERGERFREWVHGLR